MGAGRCQFPTGRTRLSGGGEGSWASAAQVEMTGRAGKQFNCRRLPDGDRSDRGDRTPPGDGEPQSLLGPLGVVTLLPVHLTDGSPGSSGGGEPAPRRPRAGRAQQPQERHAGALRAAGSDGPRVSRAGRGQGVPTRALLEEALPAAGAARRPARRLGGDAPGRLPRGQPGAAAAPARAAEEGHAGG